MNGHNLHALFTPTLTLTSREQEGLLRTTGDHVAGWRDHAMYSLDFATALRELELQALDIGDVFNAERRARRRIQLRVFKRSNSDPKMQSVRVPDRCRLKLERYLARRLAEGDEITDETPLFPSREGPRISLRQIRTAFSRWQERAGFERRVNFHALRHTSISNFYEDTRDLAATQVFARHASPFSTRRYVHIAEDRLEQAVNRLRC